MKPHLHAKNSARKYGGKPEDYQAIHDLLDSSKAHVADMRHRALLHNSFGPFLAEKVFGVLVTNSDGQKVSVRDVAEDHILEDLGRIPSVQDYLDHMDLQPWFGGRPRRRTVCLEDLLFGSSIRLATAWRRSAWPSTRISVISPSTSTRKSPMP